jgi:hypothetical protein
LSSTYFGALAAPNIAIQKNTAEAQRAQRTQNIDYQSKGKDLSAYWVDVLTSNRMSGIWTIEIRVNDQPAGSHSYELVFPEPEKPAIAEPVKTPTRDETYRSLVKSLVWIYKIDENNSRIDTSSGFVIAPDSILTAFQAIDSADKLEIEFADGSKIISAPKMVLPFEKPSKKSNKNDIKKQQNTLKGVVSLRVYDAQNRAKLSVKPVNIELPEGLSIRTIFQFSPLELETGSYRLDFTWNDIPVLRTGISIVD